MSKRLSTGFIGGCLGAVVLVIITYIMTAMGAMDAPPFVAMYRGAFGENPPGDQFIAVILFIISGGIWGLIFGFFVKTPTILKAMLFGFLPTLWLLVVVNGYLGQPLFNGFTAKGLLMPVIFNVVVWGIILGWYMRSRIVPATYA